MYQLERTLGPDEYQETFLKAKSQYMADHPIPWDTHFRAGKCTKPELQGMAKDFYYWKLQVPIKDYAILYGCPDLDIRRKWVLKAVEEDGEDISVESTCRTRNTGYSSVKASAYRGNMS